MPSPASENRRCFLTPRELLHVYVFRRCGGGRHGGRHSGRHGGRHGGRRRKLQASNGGSLEERLPAAAITASAVGLQNCPAFFPRVLPGPHWGRQSDTLFLYPDFLISRLSYTPVVLYPRFSYIPIFLYPDFPIPPTFLYPDFPISRFSYIPICLYPDFPIPPICLYPDLLIPRLYYIAISHMIQMKSHGLVSS